MIWAQVSRPLLRGISALGYAQPTPIQQRVIPLALAGRDVCASAATGSGKTVAFVLPALERVISAPSASIKVVILVPTRELASQCEDVVRDLAKFVVASSVVTALITGGTKDVHHQEALLRRRPDIVVATPGRLVDHVDNSSGVAFDDLQVCVLDEADRLLDLGFHDQIEHIIKAFPGGDGAVLGSGRGRRQTLLFSATFGAKVDALAALSLRRPVRVKIEAGRAPGGVARRLTQDFVKLANDADKHGLSAETLEREAVFLALLARLVPQQQSTTKKKKKTAIAFFDTKAQARRMARILEALAEDETLPRAAEFHGGLPQTERTSNFAKFTSGDVQVLLCTDVAGRGIDVDTVKVVMNFDMPKTVETYVHRVGRTARAGRSGLAVTIVGAKRRAVLKEYLRSRQADLDAADVEKDDDIRSRKVAGALITKYQEAITAGESRIAELEQEHRATTEQRQAEEETDRMYNLVVHADEIKNRPKRTWFQTTNDKTAQKERDRDQHSSESLAADEGRLAAARKKINEQALKKLGVSVKGKRAKDTTESGHRLTRKKRRRLEAQNAAMDDDDDDDDAIQSKRDAAEASVKRDARKAKQSKRRVEDDDLATTSSKMKKQQIKKKTTFAFDDDDFDPDDDGGGDTFADRGPTSRKFTDFDPSRVGKKKKNATGSFKSKARYKRR